jgi:hypothetical protein
MSCTTKKANEITPRSAPPEYVAYSLDHSPVYYVLTKTKVQTVGQSLATIPPQGPTDSFIYNHWSALHIKDSKIEIHKIPGINLSKAVAVKVTPKRYRIPNTNDYVPKKSEIKDYYVKAIAQKKKPY